MRRRISVALIALLHLLVNSQATDDPIPPCTREEFVTVFELIAEHQVAAEQILPSFTDILRFSQSQLQLRESALAELPNCADGFEAHRALLQLGVDIVARNALDLALLPAAENPYRQRLASDSERIEAMTAAMLGRDRTNAPRLEERRSPACSNDDLSLLTTVVAEFLGIFENAASITNLPLYIASVDRRLAWREATLPHLPACAEAIPLGLLLARASSDAAAHHALAFAGVSRRTNPYDELEAAALSELDIWLEQARLDRADGDSASSGVTGRLPACTQAELAVAHASLLAAHSQMLGGFGFTDDISLMLAASREHVDSRDSTYRQLPGCAEAFHAGWQLAEAVSDQAALVVVGEANDQAFDRAQASSVKATAALSRLESLLADQPPAATRPSRGAPTCRDAQIVYFNVYVLPAFHRYTEAALATLRPPQLDELEEQAQSFRERLWAHLPRCGETIEIGWLMRRIALDFIALLALEAAGAAPRDIPYLAAIIDDMGTLSARIDELNEDTVYAAGSIYYVSADGFANIRSCGSTECEVVGLVQRGDTLRVLDDSDVWYQIQLSGGGSAWIAGFLASKELPGP